MATESRDTATSVIEALLQDPESFDFFQAVRVVERAVSQPRLQGPGHRLFPVGHDHAADREIVRFGSTPSLRFPAAPISQVERSTAEDGVGPPFRFLLTFMGLTGQSGAMPDQFTELVIQRIRQRDPTFQAFLNIFNHRLVSLFFRAWEKYKVAPVWERAQIDPDADDPFARVLAAFVGIDQPSLAGQMAIGDNFLHYYAGLLARHPRSSSGLERMLEEVFGADCRILQFEGRWLNIAAEEQTSISAIPMAGRYAGLGVDAVCGDRVWDQQSSFRIQIGPLPYKHFERLTPGQPGLAHLRDLVRFYVGPELNFILQLLLPGDEIPDGILSSDNAMAPRLGVNAWLSNSDPIAVVSDVIYTVEPFGDSANVGTPP